MREEVESTLRLGQQDTTHATAMKYALEEVVALEPINQIERPSSPSLDITRLAKGIEVLVASLGKQRESREDES